MRTAKFLVPAALAVLAGPVAAGPVAAGPIAAGPIAAAVVAPAPKPPVITENFNPPFACNQKSNLGVQGCAERQVDSGDTRINAEVKLLFRVLYDNASRRALVTAEYAWLAYRGADCTSQSTHRLPAVPGGGRPVPQRRPERLLRGPDRRPPQRSRLPLNRSGRRQ